MRATILVSFLAVSHTSARLQFKKSVDAGEHGPSRSRKLMSPEELKATLDNIYNAEMGGTVMEITNADDGTDTNPRGNFLESLLSMLSSNNEKDADDMHSYQEEDDGTDSTQTTESYQEEDDQNEADGDQDDESYQEGGETDGSQAFESNQDEDEADGDQDNESYEEDEGNELKETIELYQEEDDQNEADGDQDDKSYQEEDDDEADGDQDDEAYQEGGETDGSEASESHQEEDEADGDQDDESHEEDEGIELNEDEVTAISPGDASTIIIDKIKESSNNLIKGIESGRPAGTGNGESLPETSIEEGEDYGGHLSLGVVKGSGSKGCGSSVSVAQVISAIFQLHKNNDEESEANETNPVGNGGLRKAFNSEYPVQHGLITKDDHSDGCVEVEDGAQTAAESGHVEMHHERLEGIIASGLVAVGAGGEGSDGSTGHQDNIADDIEDIHDEIHPGRTKEFISSGVIVAGAGGGGGGVGTGHAGGSGSGSGYGYGATSYSSGSKESDNENSDINHPLLNLNLRGILELGGY